MAEQGELCTVHASQIVRGVAWKVLNKFPMIYKWYNTSTGFADFEATAGQNKLVWQMQILANSSFIMIIGLCSLQFLAVYYDKLSRNIY